MYQHYNIPTMPGVNGYYKVSYTSKVCGRLRQQRFIVAPHRHFDVPIAACLTIRSGYPAYVVGSAVILSIAFERRVDSVCTSWKFRS
jgi:hypothetical protein